MDHRVERLGVAHAEAEARLGQQVGRARHRLHAAADADLDVARADRLVEQDRGAQARGAHLVDGLAGDLLGDPGLDLGLARGDLALAGLEDLAHDDVLHLVGRDVGALERRGDGGRAELGGIDGRQAAAELADGRAGGTEDHGLGHVPKASDVAWPADARLRHHRRSRRHRGRHDRRRRLRRRGDRARSRGRAAGRAARGRRGAHELQAPRPAPRRRPALAGRRPRRARRVRRRARAGRRRGRPRPRARARHARAVLGAAPPRPRRRGRRAGRGHDPRRLPLRPLPRAPRGRAAARARRGHRLRPPRRRRRRAPRRRRGGRAELRARAPGHAGQRPHAHRAGRARARDRGRRGRGPRPRLDGRAGHGRASWPSPRAPTTSPR